MNTPIRQHWIPRVYIKSFATPGSIDKRNPNVNVYDLELKKHFCSSIDKIFVKKHFYTLGKDSDYPLYVAEETLSKIEGWSKPCIDALAKGETVYTNLESKYAASVFFATLLMRSPHMLKIQEERLSKLDTQKAYHKEGIQNFIKNQEEKNFEELSAWVSRLDQEGKHAIFVRSIFDTASFLAKDLMQKKWRLLRSCNSYFITSDDPIVVFHPRRSPYGICTDGVHIHIAITPQILLLMGGEMSSLLEDYVHDVPQDFVEHMNYLTISKAKRFIISPLIFENLQDLIQKARQEI